MRKKLLTAIMAVLLTFSVTGLPARAEYSTTGWYVSDDDDTRIYIDGKGTVKVIWDDGTIDEYEYTQEYYTIQFEIEEYNVELYPEDNLLYADSYGASHFFGLMYKEGTEPRWFYDPASGLKFKYDYDAELITDGVTGDDKEICWVRVADKYNVVFFDYDENYDEDTASGMSGDDILQAYIDNFVDEYFVKLFVEAVDAEDWYVTSSIQHAGAEKDYYGDYISYASGKFTIVADDITWTIFCELTNGGDDKVYFSVTIRNESKGDFVDIINSILYSVCYAADGDGINAEAATPEKDCLTLKTSVTSNEKMSFTFTYTDGPQSKLTFELFDLNDVWLYSYVTKSALSKDEGSITVKWDYKCNDGTYAKEGDKLMIRYWTDEYGPIDEFITLP